MVDAMDRDGVKTVLPKGAIGYDDYAPGGDVGRIYIGTGTVNIPLAKKDDEATLGTPIASAATTTIGTAGLGDYIHITGTTTITSFGAAASAGIRRTLIFDGALTLTHNATSLICVGGVSIVTVAGTVIEVVAETTANWRVVSITHPSISATELDYLDGATSNIQTQLNGKATDSNTVHKTGDETIAGVKTLSNNLVFASGTKIIGDFSNATIANKTILQTSTLNSQSVVDAAPNGTSLISGFGAYNSSDISNSSYISFYTGNGGTSARIISTKAGTGAYLPISFATSDIERLRIDTSGNVLVIGSGGLGYGTGSGGTVTQLTSKSTAVTLNKPCGKITMHNASLAAGAVVTFQFTNSSINITDTVAINTVAATYSALNSYDVKVEAVVLGYCYITIKNNTGVALTDALGLQFAVIKGSTN